MLIATILPVPFQYLEQHNHYHMALAQLVHDEVYADFFLTKAQRGDHVLMDNGVVEGSQQPLDVLLDSAQRISATEMILPDVLCDMRQTMLLSQHAMESIEVSPKPDLMAVPQGGTPSEWGHCLKEMLDWPIRSVGISKFVVTRHIWTSRMVLLLTHLDRILAAGKEIHLLGSPEGPAEVALIERTWPGKVRGVDSGYPTFCAAGGTPITYHGQRPMGTEHLDFLDGQEINSDLMKRNYLLWREWCGAPV